MTTKKDKQHDAPIHSRVPLINSLLKFTERNLSWLPWIAIIFFVIADINISPILFDGNFELLFADEKIIGCFIALILSLIIFTLHLILCVKRATRLKAIFTLGASMSVSVLFFIIVEIVFPPVFHYTEFQHAIQAQIHRRLKSVQQLFCGVKTEWTANSLGWIDKERNINSNAKRIVFIGDSFLEIRSKKNIAARVEGMLHAQNYPLDIVNLSKTDTRPQPDYQHKFNEFSFDYKPEHTFIQAMT